MLSVLLLHTSTKVHVQRNAINYVLLGVAEDGSWSPGTRVSIESQFIVDNTEYKYGITNNVIFFSRSAPLLSSLFCPDSYTSLSHESFDQL